MSTSNRVHGELLCLLFLQAHRETEAHFTAAGMPSQRNQSESFRIKRAAFYQGLKSKVGLAAASPWRYLMNKRTHLSSGSFCERAMPLSAAVFHGL
jgi:hypothetical protein